MIKKWSKLPCIGTITEKRKSSSSIFSVKDLHYNELLSLSHEFVIAESGFSEEGTYEAKLVVNADDYNLRCRPYYSSFMLSSNGFGSSQVVLSATEIELRYYGQYCGNLSVC